MLVSYLVNVHVPATLPCLLICYYSVLYKFASISSIIDNIFKELSSIKRQLMPALAFTNLTSLPIFERSLKFDIATKDEIERILLHLKSTKESKKDELIKNQKGQAALQGGNQLEAISSKPATLDLTKEA